MRKYFFFFGISCLLVQFAHSQAANNDNPFPSIVPPSPELASLANVAQLDASNYTGAASTQIPLYDLKVGSLGMPIALHYASNGIRVNDIPSRVGLGWNLIAGGSITKIVHDEEDDNPSTHYLAPPPNWNVNEALSTYLFYANMEHYDTEHDEYAYNVNGLSGKFFIDENGAPQFQDKSDVQISRFSDGNFLLIDGNGTKYYFGAAREKTYDIKLNGQVRGNVIKTTGYFLSMIVSQEGDEIDFHYQDIQIRTYLGSSQSVILRHPNYYYFDPNVNCDICKENFPFTVNGSYNQVFYNTYFLSSISTSNGMSVTFDYATRGDESNDNRLINLFVSNDNLPGRQIKNYSFYYDNYPISGDQQLRYYLSRISTFPGGTNPESLDYTFSYYSPSTLPSQASFQQDYFGYASAINNFYFWPRFLGYEDYNLAGLGADRSPDFNSSRAGTLQKVTFPTGGSEEFIFEPHTLQEPHSESAFSYTHLYAAGTGLDLPVTVTKTITIGNSSENVHIDFDTHQNPSGPSSGTGFWNGGSGQIVSYLKVKQGSNIIYEEHHLGFDITAYDWNLNLNQTYTIELTVKGLTNLSEVAVRYNETIQTTLLNDPGCGIRVKQIKSYDPISNKYTSKYYTYSSLDNLVSNPIQPAPECLANYSNTVPPLYLSSGVGQLTTANADFYPKGGWCTSPTQFIGNILEMCTGYVRASSSSVSGVHTFAGSSIAYTNIIESDDPDFVHGGIEHTYDCSYLNENVSTILNYPPRNFIGFGSNMEGKETKTRIFKRDGSSYIVLKEMENIYSSDSRVTATASNYPTIKRFEPVPKDDKNLWDAVLKAYDIGGYLLMSGWTHLDTKITTTYDESGANPLVERTDYAYDDVDHCQPTTIITTNSKNETVIKTLKYPKDFYNSSVFSDMVSAHIISPVIEESVSVAGNPISKIYTQYEDWNPNNTHLYKPSVITFTKANLAPEIKGQYHTYDLYGNPEQLVKDDGISTVYLWNYFHSFPVAEIKNAIYKEVAYTSFEAEDHGNWTYDDSGVHSDGITGTKCYTGNIKTSFTSASCILTLWTKAEVFANSTAGNLITTKGNWKLYKWIFNGVSNVDIDGVDIDEVRLIPSNAHITTYTFFPEIGINSICDDNNNIVYYEYDGLNRLLLVRDIDKNILKQNEYKYHIAVDPCSHTPNWVLTGNLRCVQGGSNNNYTGAQEAEKKDMNNCSSTYLQSMWVAVASPPVGVCDAIACTGIDKRVVNGVCETGIKVLTQPCSATCDCSFRYWWCDGSHSVIYTESNSSLCTPDSTPPQD